MPTDFLHSHSQFEELIRIVADQTGVEPALVLKDYWIMHSLYGLQQMGLRFELKGGTSLSKGYGFIDRFSEDIDIRIEPPPELKVAVGPNQTKPAQVESRKAFYDHLAATIKIDGIESVERDYAFDDAQYYRGAGIRLIYGPTFGSVPGVKDGILLEVGFDVVTPNRALDISSWAYDYAAPLVDIIDNRAKQVACYHPGYTLIEKLQAISTKFRKQRGGAELPPNFTRHYYDVSQLLVQPMVQELIGTEAYFEHKKKRFRSEDLDLTKNPAFVLSQAEVRERLAKSYAASEALYYRGQPKFDEVMAIIQEWTPRL